jgi:RimJ/RimL family protein N-acetyltransferase
VLVESIREQQSRNVIHGGIDTLPDFPTLESKLVRLRQLRYKDIPRMPRLVTADVVRYLVHVPYPYEMVDARRFINKSRRNFKLKKELDFAIELVDNGGLVGVMSLQKIDRVSKNAQMG